MHSRELDITPDLYWSYRRSDERRFHCLAQHDGTDLNFGPEEGSRQGASYLNQFCNA